MSALPIRRFPDPVLKRSTQLVGRVDDNIRIFINQLIRAMRSYPRCVGLAAPQVGRNVRIAVIDTSAHPKAKKSCGLLVLVNPSIVMAKDWEMQREGCLSVPDFTANVKRASHVRIKTQDASGLAYEMTLTGFDAIASQHEIDHLDGKLFLDRVINLKTDLFRRKVYR